MQSAGAGRAGDAHHRSAAQTTEQLPREHILPVFPMPPLGIFLVLQPLVHSQEQRPVDDRRNAILHPDIPEAIDPHIGLVRQQAVKAIPAPEAAPLCSDAPAIQVVGDLDERDAVGHLAEDLTHHLRLPRIDGEATILALAVPERNGAAVHLAIHGIIPHPPSDILRQVGGVILGGAFQDGLQQDALRAVWNGLLRIQHPDAAPLQPELIGGGVISVPGKAVDLPDDQIGPAPMGGIPQHSLKLGPLIRHAGERPVGIDLYHPEAQGAGIGLAVGHLLLDGHIPLVVGGIAGIDDTVALAAVKRQIALHHRPPRPKTTLQRETGLASERGLRLGAGTGLLPHSHLLQR